MVGRLHEAVHAAAVEAAAAEAVGEHPAVLGLLLEGVGDLDLAPLARFGPAQPVEDIRREDIAADDGEVARRLLGSRLLHHLLDVVEAGFHLDTGDDAVLVGLRRVHLLDGDDAAPVLGIDLGHLPQYAIRFVVADAQIVGQHHAEGLVAHQGLAGEDGVAEAAHLFLAGVGEGAGLDEAVGFLQELLLVAAGNRLLQDGIAVEEVLDGVLTLAGDDGDVVHPGLQGLLHTVLDQRLVDDGQHLLGNGLGGGQETGAVTGRGKETLADHGIVPGFVDGAIFAESRWGCRTRR